MAVMQGTPPKAIKAKLKRIEGQIRGILGMIEEDRYCVDILTQISAVRSALHGVEKDVLENHVSTCVSGAFCHGDKREQQKKMEELVKILSRMTK
jgi:DNA-binding FrmR family transcriptional regulator